MYMTLSRPGNSELMIRKSRFIGCVTPVTDRVAAQAAVTLLRLQHPGAAHVCWALLAGGHSAAVDDGEPGGTAGRPMLEVLRHQQLDGVLATAVRYFGGIKLGTGGLLRAYTDCIAQALHSTEKRPLQRLLTLCCQVPYACEGVLRRHTELVQGNVLQVSHATDVTFELEMAADLAAAFISRINDATQGRASWIDTTRF